MITLGNFENFVPYKMLMRGEEYYDTDTVSELEEISPSECTATVEGTDDYNVEIFSASLLFGDSKVPTFVRLSNKLGYEKVYKTFTQTYAGRIDSLAGFST